MKEQIKHALPTIRDDTSLSKFMQNAQRFPVLTATEEYEYASHFVKFHDRESAEKLVSSHLRLVISMAYELKDYGIPVGELIASGNVGLMQALRKFDPEKGFRFSTYATFWVKAEMYDLILNNWSIVKIGNGPAQKKVFFNLARAKKALGIMDSKLSGEQIKQIADKLEVREQDVIDMSTRMHFRDSSLDIQKYDDGNTALVDLVPDDTKPTQSILEEHEINSKRHNILKKYLSDLPERDREILIARRLTDPAKTLETLSEQYGISRERIRQIEERAFLKIKTAITENPISTT